MRGRKEVPSGLPRVVYVVYVMTQQTVRNTYYGPSPPRSQQRELLPPRQGDKERLQALRRCEGP